VVAQTHKRARTHTLLSSPAKLEELETAAGRSLPGFKMGHSAAPESGSRSRRESRGSDIVVESRRLDSPEGGKGESGPESVYVSRDPVRVLSWRTTWSHDALLAAGLPIREQRAVVYNQDRDLVPWVPFASPSAAGAASFPANGRPAASASAGVPVGHATVQGTADTRGNPLIKINDNKNATR
jgi:hypothetical protein